MPFYKHDCMNPRCCKYIGSTDCTDVYLYGTHSAFDDRKGVLIRFGDDGPEYSSLPNEIWKRCKNKYPDEAKIVHNWIYSGV
jgi:hypothetical protein